MKFKFHFPYRVYPAAIGDCVGSYFLTKNVYMKHLKSLTMGDIAIYAWIAFMLFAIPYAFFHAGSLGYPFIK